MLTKKRHFRSDAAEKENKGNKEDRKEEFPAWRVRSETKPRRERRTKRKGCTRETANEAAGDGGTRREAAKERLRTRWGAGETNMVTPGRRRDDEAAAAALAKLWPRRLLYLEVSRSKPDPNPYGSHQPSSIDRQSAH